MRIPAALLALLLPLTVSAQRDLPEVDDAYGYVLQRSPHAECAADWIDLGGGTPLVPVAAGSADADDDGGAAISLPLPFQFYGEPHSDLVVSTNGYLAFAADPMTEDGGHWRADCPLPAIPDNRQASFARIHALQADLERGLGGDLRWQHFADCPRASAQGAEACSVIQWQGWQRRAVAGMLDMQIVLYHQSWEITVQYGALDAAAAAGTTIGIQDAGASSAKLAGCGDAPAPMPFSAICFLDPSSQGAPNFLIQTLAMPAQGGETSGGGSFQSGDPVTVLATPNTGYHFVDWREDDTIQSTEASYGFAAAANRLLVASFALDAYLISVVTSPPDAGSVQGAGTYLHGEPVTLQATAADGFVFAEWLDGVVSLSEDPTLIFSAAGDRGLVARFEPQLYAIATTAVPAEGGSVTGAGTYAHGSSVELLAAAAAGYAFVEWREAEAVVGTEPTLSFTASSDRSVEAHFEALPATLFADGFE